MHIDWLVNEVLLATAILPVRQVDSPRSALLGIASWTWLAWAGLLLSGYDAPRHAFTYVGIAYAPIIAKVG